MKIAVMQPYFFPYIGYFKLIESVDIFVFLNNVQFTKRGWMNRNRINFRNGKEKLLTIPVKKHTQKTNINEIKIQQSENWFSEHSKLLELNYGRSVLDHPILKEYAKYQNEEYLDQVLMPTVKFTANYLGLNKTQFLISSELDLKPFTEDLPSRYHKILQLCEYLKADEYINPYGGRELYDEDIFKQYNVNLKFMEKPNYENMFSILDVIFRCK